MGFFLLFLEEENLKVCFVNRRILATLVAFAVVDDDNGDICNGPKPVTLYSKFISLKLFFKVLFS